MLHRAQDLHGLSLEATDGDVGSVEDFYFSDEDWAVRYLVVRTGSWLFGRHALIGATSLQGLDVDRRVVKVDLTREAVENAPEIGAHPPVSEQERAVERARDARWSTHMLVPHLAASPPSAAHQELSTRQDTNRIERLIREQGDEHLRSMDEVIDYEIAAKDETVGSVEDFLIDPERWRVAYLAVHTGNWLPGRIIAIAPEWIAQFDWNLRRILVRPSKDAIEKSPNLSSLEELSEDKKRALSDHYAAWGF